ncbi:tRNA-intron endonuclease, variant [Verruconis gallopava]|uniref:tRNA-splicing endonuclease subunit Sen34 n=1 Tax=Verruconis gallopava TaxID=253628 RepID=A0A0D1YFQ1_9PEZI|nr:tRNA-intron endonuclease, variant [Verruconis gallopava]KIV99561.1 tRNA-intron endonuclease, variant [Verruconis gallopava]
MVQVSVSEPFLISEISSRYFVFDVSTVTHMRSKHHICGVLIGNIPQATQQTVFSGIPLELMPEEARLLVEKGHAFIADDVAGHASNLANLNPEEKKAFIAELEREGLEGAQMQRQQSLQKKQAHLKRAGSSMEAIQSSKIEPLRLTPTTSYPPLHASPIPDLPKVPSSYPLFAHLHEKGYFMGPGLRFGCQYVAYPGDPLRYHSHFLVTSYEWDEEIDLLDIVGGGRLGTGVKKGYMIGGARAKDDQ